MNSCELVSIVTAIACAIANCVPAEDLPLLTAMLGQLSSTLATITVNQELEQPKEVPPVPPTAPDTSVITVQALPIK